jgi:hypothetical protein
MALPALLKPAGNLFHKRSSRLHQAWRNGLPFHPQMAE